MKKFPTAQEIENVMMSWPGKRSIDIPEHIFDKIQPVAQGITKQIWGDNVQPQQLQHLYQNGHHTPDAIHAEFGKMPHPLAPSVQVSEYEKFSKAKELFDKHQK